MTLRAARHCLFYNKINHKYSKIKFLYEKYHSKSGVFGYKPYKRATTHYVSHKDLLNRNENCSVYNLIKAYREHGHKNAKIDPLGLRKLKRVPELEISQYGFEASNLSDSFTINGLLNGLDFDVPYKLEEIVHFLNAAYCGSASVEFMHLPNFEEREWLAEEFESLKNESLADATKRTIASDLIKSQVFENFLQTKFPTVKRYSGEGADSMITFFSSLFQTAASDYGLSNIVIGMPHRGRLSLMTVLLKFPPVAVFQKIKGFSEFAPGSVGTGDVLSHLFTSVNLPNDLHVMLLPNPSHLEAICPVTVGKARGRMESLKVGDYSLPDFNSEVTYPVLPIQVHGDAAMAAQGIVMETLAMSNVPHYRIGGSVHLVVNNQLGFTTPAHRGSSSLYCSDLMKMIGAPIFHVNGDFPEDVAKVVQLALKYRCQFNKDVLVDMVCFRLHGHNEIDDPTYTNPVMYSSIHSRPHSCPDMYANKLIEEGIWSTNELKDLVKTESDILNSHFKEIGSYQPQSRNLVARWQGTENPPTSITKWETGLPSDLLRYIGAKSVEIPDNFKIHKNLHRVLVAERPKRLSEGVKIDWATAETLAIGSLLYQGFNVRISGQDVGRGTFSHRHWMFVDQETDDIAIPLNNLLSNQKGFLEVANSILSEEAVLAFEYGMSIESPNNLIIWEAQFGDFFNGAQIILDNFISSGETKWLYQSGIVILLPHGMDGAGPEHSSSHFERFLQMCDSREEGIDGDDRNWKIVNPTTPAQYFHLLRRQMLQNFRKPLVVVAPKIILRLPAASSTLDDFGPKKTFSPILGDPLSAANADKVETVIFCSGKHFYELHKEREARGRANDTVLIRLEALCPFPAGELSEELQKYRNVKKYIWSQEEHRNMGAWTFVRPRFDNLLQCKLKYAGRKELAAAAVGIGVLHQKEVKEIMDETFNI